MLDNLNRITTKVSGKATLRTVLIILFVLQIVGTVGLVGYLSLRSGEKAVENLAGQLVEEVSDRVKQNLHNYLSVPQQINQNNAAAIRLGILNWKDFSTLERYFAQQLQIYPTASSVAIATEQKEALFVERFLKSDSLLIRVIDASTNYAFHYYTADRQGKRGQLTKVRGDYNPHNDPPNGRPWYLAAKQAKQAIWLQSVTLSQGVKNPLLQVVNFLPFYDKGGSFQGVLASSLYLTKFDSFLNSLKIGRTGQAFVIDRKGFLISSSTGETPFKQNLDADYLQNLNPQDWRFDARNSRNPLTQASMNFLLSHFGNLSQITGKKLFDFQVGNARQFLQVTPVADEYGLDYLVVVVVPEADFTEQIDANTRTTILLYILALIPATTIGIISGWITKPILRLNTAAKDIAQGKLDKTVEIHRSDEVGQLAKSFNSMAGQLQASFSAIQESENRITQFLEALPLGVSVHDPTGKLTYANQISKQLLGIDTLLDATTEELAQAYRVYLSGTKQLYPIEEMPIVKALSGENSTADDLELDRGDRIIPLEVRATPIYDEKGEVVYAIAAFTDITERKQAQKILADYNQTLEHQVIKRTSELIQINQRLQHEIAERQRVEAEIIRSKDLLESIFNESTDAIFLVNPETLLITDCNRRAVELFEAHSKDELLNIEGRTLQKESFTSEELHSIVDEISLYGFWSRELEYVTKKGNVFWGNLAVKEINVAGQTMHIVRVTDITARKQAEQQLRESKHFIERIANASPNLWYIYDHVEQRNVYFNRELAAVLGYTPEEMQAMGSALLQTIVHPDDLARFPAHLKQWKTATDDEVFEIDYRVRNAQGEWRTLLTLETVFERNPDGTVKQVIGTSTDITDRKRAEVALRDNVIREKAIGHVLQRMRCTLDINTIFCATTRELRQVLKSDRVAIYRFNPDWSGEFVAESVGNGWISLVAQQKNDQKLTEKALEYENCTIKTWDEPDLVQDTYLQRTQGGIYSQGANYRAVEDIYNTNFTKCYINLLERFQAKAYLIVPIFFGTKLWGLLAAYQNSGSRCWSEGEIKVMVQIGTQLGIALQQAQLLQKTQEQAVELNCSLDKLKRTQVQLIQAEKMSSLGQMVAGIAHEINNPVSFIYGNLIPADNYLQDVLSLLELYQKAYPNPRSEIQQLSEDIDLDFLVEDWQKLMDSMKVGAERIREIVYSLRNFSRLDEKELKSVDIHEGINNTILILQHRLRAGGNSSEIKLIKNYGHLPKITCYANQLNQVFMNILNNAIDALENTPFPRMITIHTSVVSDKKQQENLVSIRIKDNGSGMSEEVRTKIFDPFFTTKPVGSGTGLGLSICYQIVVEQHKGQITCISALGQGTEFIVEIPLVAAA